MTRVQCTADSPLFKGVALAMLLPLMAAALGVLAPSTPATAAQAPSVSVSAPATVVAGRIARFKGRVSGRSVGATVVLQRDNGRGWTAVKRGRVSRTKSFLLSKRVAAIGRHRFRVKVLGTRSLRTAASRPVTVRVTRPKISAPAQAPEELAKVRTQILEATNEFRASQGLAPLLPMPELDTVATKWAVHLAETGRFEHNPSYFSEYPQTNLWGGAENIAAGYPSAAGAVQGWSNSPGHRANMLGNYTHMGVGFARDASGIPYYVQNFAAYGE